MRVTRKVWVLSIALCVALASPALAQQFNWQQAKGTQLRVLLNKHPWQGAIEPHLKEFETLTGIKLIAGVKDRFQVTLPTVLRQKAGLVVGDLLEATVRGKTITLTPGLSWIASSPRASPNSNEGGTSVRSGPPSRRFGRSDAPLDESGVLPPLRPPVRRASR